MPQPKAYSYLRFSTPEQSRGDSTRRQTDAADTYALRHGLELDASLRFEDRGVSGFTGANVRQGALGQFLRAVDDGIVVPGHEYAQWKRALRLHKGQPQQVYSEDDMEAMWDAEARSGADKMVRAVGRRPADRPEVLARMIEYYSGRRIHAVIRLLQERNAFDEDEDNPF